MNDCSHSFPMDEGKPLRCALCGEQIGLQWGDLELNPEVVVVRCYACAATEEAESITKDASA